MIDVVKTRNLYEAHAGPDRKDGKGRRTFVNLIRHGLGLCDEAGNNYRDRAGHRVLRESESKFSSEEFSLQETAEAIIGPAWRNIFNPSKQAQRDAHNRLLESDNPDDSRALLEGVGVGVDVSSFADINAWTATTGGLIERKILERFNRPDFIGDDLMPDEPTRIAEGQKIIGVSRIGDFAESRQPGMPHKRAGFGERYITLQKTRENALAVDVNKEAVWFDLTGQVLDEAGEVGELVGYRREIDKIDAFLGVTTQSTGLYKFTYKGTAYNTYSTSAPYTNGPVNSQTNVLTDWLGLQASWLAFVRMLDPETGIRIMVRPDTMLVNPGNLAIATLILNQAQTQRRTAGATLTQATAVNLNVGTANMNPADMFGAAKLLWSPLVEQRCTDASGLALSQANTDILWFHFQRGKPFRYFANWPLTLTQAPGTSYDQIDRGVIFSMFANERGMPGVTSPWHVMKNTN
jgi:hypothetical protein